MKIECMEEIQEALITEVKGHLNELDKVNIGQLGCVIKMIKGLSEAIYYDTVVESMNKKEEETTKA